MKVEYIDHMGDDSSVVRAARVSFAQDDKGFKGKRDESLIQYLAKHHHWTPFSHTSITLRLTAPVPIRTQCFKHKVGFTENEESRRYVSYVPEYYVPTFRTQADNKKQGSGEEVSAYQQGLLAREYVDAMNYAIGKYEELLGMGVAEEQARFVLPQGCMVNWYWTGSLSAYARFYKQRTDSHAQAEIQELSKMVGDIIKPLYPVAWAALTGEE